MAGFRERIETQARAISFRHFVAFRPSHGGSRGVERLQLFVRDPFHRFPASSITAAPNCWSCRHRFVLGLASAYFFYLAVLKTKLAREQRNRDGTRE